ncbi:MAG: hypothetical protein WBA93_22120 [Microcoleaceae cyanobacterium]
MQTLVTGFQVSGENLVVSLEGYLKLLQPLGQLLN